MLLDQLEPRTVERFGGLVTLVSAYDLAPGQSPAANDVEFFPGGWRSRRGLGSVLTGPGTVLSGLKETATANGVTTLLGLSANGDFWRENAGSYLLNDDTVNGGKYELSMWMRSCTAFGREFIGFSDGARGASPPREYSVANGIARLTQHGPSEAVTVADTVHVGTIDAGVHRVIEVFLLRNGAQTGARGYATFTAAGSLTANATGLTIGPENVIGRRFFMTTANSSGPYFCVPDEMTVWDNSTTSWEFDITDAELIAAGGKGFSADQLLRATTIGPAAGVEFYNSRLFAWGCKEEIAQGFDSGFANPHFDGGFYDDAGDDVPCGFEKLAVGGTGGSKVSGMGGATGDVYTITSDGASASLGAVFENQTDARSIFASATQTFRARVKLSTGGLGTAGGALRVRLVTLDVGLAITATHGTLLFNLTGATAGQWTTLEGTMTPSGTWPATQVEPVRLAYDLAANGSAVLLAAANEVQVDSLVVAQTQAQDRVWASRIEDVNGFDGVSGFIRVQPGDGTSVRNLFRLGRLLYAAKDQSLWAISDTGAGEPVSWPIEMVSDVVGASGPNAIGVGDGFAVICGRNGVFLFDGTSPVSISKEIDPTWRQVNWNYGHLIWCVVDRDEQTVYIGVPWSSGSPASEITRVFTIDYSMGWEDGARNWSPWTVAAASCALSLRSSGARVPLFGGKTLNNAVYSLGVWGTALADAGTAIPYQYDTSLLSLPSVAVRHLFGYMTMRIEGAGAPVFKAVLPDASTVALPQTGTHFGAALPSLAASPLHDLEVGINLTATKLGIRVGPNASTTAYARVQRLTVWCRENPTSAVRGGGVQNPTTGVVSW